jgi:hypothetical protein
MNGRRALTGLSLLCALVFCAFAAPSALAATTGTTSFTCHEVTPGTGSFADAHCVVGDAKGKFTHLGYATTTAAEGTNASTKNETKEATSAVLTTTAGGLETEIVATTVNATGSVTNSLEGERHRVKGSEIVIIYTGLSVPKPAGQGCKVKGGEIKSNSLKSEDVEMTEVFSPTAGTEFVTVTLEGCKTAGLNKAYAVTGTVAATSSGATAIVNLPKAGSTLEFGGQKAGLQQTVTNRNRANLEALVTTTAPFTE